MSLLSQKQIEDLTDCKQRSGQIEWLRSRGWRFEIGETGRPKVDSEEYRRHMVGGATEDPPRKGPDTSWYGQTQKAL